MRRTPNANLWIPHARILLHMHIPMQTCTHTTHAHTYLHMYLPMKICIYTALAQIVTNQSTIKGSRDQVL